MQHRQHLADEKFRQRIQVGARAGHFKRDHLPALGQGQTGADGGRDRIEAVLVNYPVKKIATGPEGRVVRGEFLLGQRVAQMLAFQDEDIPLVGQPVDEQHGQFPLHFLVGSRAQGGAQVEDGEGHGVFWQHGQFWEQRGKISGDNVRPLNGVFKRPGRPEFGENNAGVDGDEAGLQELVRALIDCLKND